MCTWNQSWPHVPDTLLVTLLSNLYKTSKNNLFTQWCEIGERKSIEQCLSRFLFSKPRRDFYSISESLQTPSSTMCLYGQLSRCVKRLISGTEVLPLLESTGESPPGSSLSQVLSWHLRNYWRRKRGMVQRESNILYLPTSAQSHSGEKFKGPLFPFNCHFSTNLRLLHTILFLQGNGQTDTLLKQTHHSGWL